MKAHIVVPLVLMGLFSVGSAYAMTHEQAKQLEIAASNGNAKDLAKLEEAGRSGDFEALRELLDYWGGKKDKTKLTYWIKKGAEQGNVNFQIILATNYLFAKKLNRSGLDIPHDPKNGVYWFKKAAAQGSTRAELALGYAYYHGLGVKQNIQTSIKWWKKSAAKGGKYGIEAKNLIKNAEKEVASKSYHYHSLVDLVNESPYANNGKKYHIYFSKVVQLISEHNDLLDYKGNYYVAKFKGYAPQRGNFITGYCSGLGAIRYQSVDNKLEIVPHVFFYRFKAYSLDNLKYVAMAENLEMEQMMAIGMQAIGGNKD